MIRDIPGYEGRYAASEDGRIWSHISRRFLRPTKGSDGYLNMTITDAAGKRKACAIGRLVAMAFIGAPGDGRDQVNHIDGVRDNNRVNNLEWVTQAENYKHSVEVLGRAPLRYKGKPVLRISKTGEIKRYPNGLAAQRDGFWSSGISDVCAGKRSEYLGYQWRFESPLHYGENMATQRIYSITEVETGEVLALVTAATKAQALAHYARRTLGCAVAIPEQLIDATKRGIEVERAGEEASE